MVHLNDDLRDVFNPRFKMEFVCVCYSRLPIHAVRRAGAVCYSSDGRKCDHNLGLLQLTSFTSLDLVINTPHI
jgi:hypothetical protein